MSSLLQSAYRRLAVRSNVSVGCRLHVGPGSRLWAPNGLEVGDDVYVGKWCTIEVDGTIGDGCLIANNVGIVGRSDHDLSEVGSFIRRARWVGDQPEASDLTTVVDVGCDVWIGYGAILLAPVRIGRGAVVAAGAVVVNDVAPYAIVAGNPAIRIGERFDRDAQAEHERRLSRGTARR